MNALDVQPYYGENNHQIHIIIIQRGSGNPYKYQRNTEYYQQLQDQSKFIACSDPTDTQESWQDVQRK